MSKLRAIATGYVAGDRTLYTIQQKGWFWWNEIGSVWARTPEEALRLGTSYNA